MLLLDDVFSELDPHRSAALAACLPEGQTLLTSAGPVPEGLPVAQHALSPRRRPVPGVRRLEPVMARVLFRTTSPSWH